jgi:hypothetical protein
MNCQECGAVLDPSALACPYCRAPTPVAARARDEEQRRASYEAAQHAYAAEHERRVGLDRLERAASTSLWTSLGSIILCCVPVLQAVSIAMYLRARSTAKALGVPVPAKATAGLAVSLATLLGGGAFMTWAFLRDRALATAAEERIAVLEKQTAASAQATSLDAPTACALAELHTLRDGFGGERGHNLTSFQCVGRLTVQSDRASVEDFRFRAESHDKKFTATVCLKRGAKWFVSEMKTDGDCGFTPATGQTALDASAPARSAPIPQGSARVK